MATILNASTSAGLVQTADTTGNLSLQSGGTTILALTSAGTAVTGTLSTTSTAVIGSGVNGVMQINNASGNNGATLWFSGASVASGNKNWLINVGDFRPGGFSIAQASTAGGAIGSSGTEAIYIVTGGTSWTSASDETLKNITGEFVGALNQVAKSRTVRGAYKYDPDTPHSFLIAQDWQDYLPEAVATGNDGKLGLSYTETIPVAFAAIKELIAKNEALEARLAALEAK